MSDAELYERDFFTWTQRQAAKLRREATRRANSDVDFDNIAEEIESLGRSQMRALTSSYRLIAMHLLKLIYQPERKSESWIETIRRERRNIEDEMDDSPGLKAKRRGLFARAYRRARRDAAFETGMPIKTFPEKPPFSLDQIERHDWLPSA